MATKKYPIGTRIRFLYNNEDEGKTGVITDVCESSLTIYLPTAEKHIKRGYYPTDCKGNKMSWYCTWNQIEVIPQVGQQLLFSFME